MASEQQISRVWRLQQMGKALSKTDDAALQRDIVEQMQLEFKPVIGQPLQELLAKKLD